ncbi:NAD(P)/FAD-dependent oxidoreductase [Angustibacter aerolatus]
MDPVIVVGAGISGVTCARELDRAGLPVRVLDRGRRIGGRMALQRTGSRVVDTGASYLTASDDAFTELVDDWQARGLARPWTSSLATLDADGLGPAKDGPMRWAAPQGLRSLVDDLARGLPVESGRTVQRVDVRGGDGGGGGGGDRSGGGRGDGGARDGGTAGGGALSVDGEPASAVVLAMPDPQARRLLPSGHPLDAALDREWLPVLALAAGWHERTWPQLTGAFADDPDVSFVADDGSRRGDDAPVLVVHSTPELAARHLDDPDTAAAPLLAAADRLLGTGTDPVWWRVRRWTFARPADGRSEPFHLGDDLLGVCGDGWAERSKVEAAYLSGRALGRALADRLS